MSGARDAAVPVGSSTTVSVTPLEAVEFPRVSVATAVSE